MQLGGWYFCTIVTGVPFDADGFDSIVLERMRYFVTSDVGDGRIQWYAFCALPPGTHKAVSFHLLISPSWFVLFRAYVCLLVHKPATVGPCLNQHPFVRHAASRPGARLETLGQVRAAMPRRELM